MRVWTKVLAVCMKGRGRFLFFHRRDVGKVETAGFDNRLDMWYESEE